MRLSSLLLVVVTVFWTSSSEASGLARQSGWLQQLGTALAVSMLTVAPLAAADDPAWERVRNIAPAHHASTFYLLINAGNTGWRVMHTELVDLNKKDEPLLVGMRIYVISGEGIGRINRKGERLPLFGLVEMTLVGHRGVVVRDAEVEEVASFAHPGGASYDQTLLTIRGVNFSKYTPIRLAPYPSAGTELEMLSYRVDADNKIKFLTYPLRSRDCQVMGFNAELSVGASTCLAAEDAFSIIGAPIFAKDDATLVAFYYGEDDDGVSKGTAMLPELQLYMRRKLAVDEQNELTSLWGAIKAGH